MRLLRLVALFGSLGLLTATLVLVVERRSDVRDDQDARVLRAADAALVSMESNLSGAIGLVGATGSTLPADAGDARLAAAATELASLTPNAAACAATAVRSVCTADDLFALDVTGELLGAANTLSGELVAAADQTTGAAVVLRHALPTGANDGDEPVTVVVSLPADDLVSGFARSLAAAQGAEYTLRVVDESSRDARDEAGEVDGLVLVRDRISEVFVAGSIDVVTAVDGSVALFGDASTLLIVLFAMAAVLLVLTAVSFLADRRTLEQRATTDGLTGLLNRREFEHRAEESIELADRFGTGLTIMMIDLNGFKAVNDTLGHQYGDLVLKGVADRLLTAVRDSDTVGRWGGDEFVVLFPGLGDSTAIRARAERISSAMRDAPVVGDTVMTASIGAASFPRHGSDFGALMQTADAAMYAAKTGGVDFRVADVELARRANGMVADPPPPADEGLVVTHDYVGPDRRSLGDDVHDGAVGPPAPADVAAGIEPLPPPAAADDVFDVDDSSGSDDARDVHGARDPR